MQKGQFVKNLVVDFGPVIVTGSGWDSREGIILEFERVGQDSHIPEDAIP